MGKFENALGQIEDAIKDIASLEVVTYKGNISIQAEGSVPDTFADIITNAKAQANFRILACTYSSLDGDMKVFYDNDITATEMDAHHKLVESARQNRQAVVDLFKDAIIKALD